jgi:hypothetical protein
MLKAQPRAQKDPASLLNKKALLALWAPKGEVGRTFHRAGSANAALRSANHRKSDLSKGKTAASPSG